MAVDYLKFFMQYSTLPDNNRDVGIFEVSGYPHYENVCSNILAFYLNPKNEHGLGGLVISSLLHVSGNETDNSFRYVKVEREYATASGGRLDLLVVTDRHVIGVENKIFHVLDNDLMDYKATIDGLCINELPVRIVLSLNPVDIIDDSGFVNVTYDVLWGEVKRRLGSHMSSSSMKWIAYLVDFMNSTKNMKGGDMDFTERDQFIMEHDEIISRLLDDRRTLDNKIKAQLALVKEILDENKDYYVIQNLEKRWIFKSSDEDPCLVHDFNLTGIKVAFDLCISEKGWELTVFGRNNVSSKYVSDLVSAGNSSISIKNGKHVLARWPISDGPQQVSKSTYTVIKALMG